MRRAPSFWRRPFNADGIDAEMREEIETHIALARAHLISQGVSAAEAEQEARARFGDFSASMNRMYSSARQREARMNRKEWLDEVRQDVRLAFRLFRRSPVFFLAAILTLAVGIGANGAVFSVLQASLLQPLPYRSPEGLVMLWRNFPNRPPPEGKKTAPLVRGATTAPMVLNFRDEVSGDVGEVAAMLTGQGNLEAQFDMLTADQTERLQGALVTPNFFSVLGVQAAHGRLFTSADEANNAPLVVLGNALWQREFGGDTTILGKSVSLVLGQPRERRLYTVVGVLPPGVQFSYPEPTVAWVMVPWSFLRDYPPNALGFTAMVRLRPGISLAAAQQRATLFRTGLDRPGEELDQRQAIALEPMHEWVVGETRPPLLLLGAVAGLLLLITCVTVANGLLARISERQQELAVRASLGAGRGRLVRQLLTEGALLSASGALAGTLLAIVVQPLLRQLLPAAVPQVGGIGIDASILLFGTTMAVVTTLLAAVAPAWGGARDNGSTTLNHAAGHMSASRHTVRLRQVLVGMQAAVATALLISATLLLVSFWKLGRVPLGFDSTHVMTLETRLLGPKYRDRAEVARVQDALIERVKSIPGVSEAALTSAVPFRGVDFMQNFESSVPRPAANPNAAPRKGPPPGLANARYVDDGYFGVLRIPLLQGRLIAPSDRKGTPLVAVVSEAFAKDMFGDANPIGQQIKGYDALEIVGVVGDVRYSSRDNDPWPAVYLSRAQTPENLICIMVRTDIDVGGMAAALTRAVHEVEPDLPPMKFATLDQIIDDTVANRRFYTVATVSFALLALLLTVVGLTVVVSRAVNERRREFAIRSALGATLSRLFQSASTDVVIASVLGVLVGGAGVYATATLLTQFLFGITSRAPLPYSASALAIVFVTLCAAAPPILRLRYLTLSALLKAE